MQTGRSHDYVGNLGLHIALKSAVSSTDWTTFPKIQGLKGLGHGILGNYYNYFFCEYYYDP